STAAYARWPLSYFFFRAEDGIRGGHVTGVQTCALPISGSADDRADRDRDEGDARRVRRRDAADRRTRADRSGIRARRTDEGAAAASGRGGRGAQARAPVEATQLTTRTRVAMVWPEVATVASGVVGVRAEADDAAELVDQAHFGEQLRVLG